ncbi:hypothetical protein [Paucidesulfovibrio longus]|uniref:hypothetical protein n=1 Tax=Paucidesulfovibrio longus TaxID=889 RepID=UPI0003B6EC22|nr:hypothetical protein [Paucidesulfovibrio longus]
MKKTIATITTLLLLAAFATTALAGEVAQGRCVSIDAQTLVIEEFDLVKTPENKNYGNPTGIESSFDLAAAKIGIPPEPGDILRIAYDVKGNAKHAIKVMNVSKQDLSKK